MKKCTLCIDRIYNDNLDEAERVPACVAACPTSARHFGDLGDPESAVSLLVKERGGVDLMPELGYRPTNKYLPPRDRKARPAAKPLEPAFAEGGFFALGRSHAILAVTACIRRFPSSSSQQRAAPATASSR